MQRHGTSMRTTPLQQQHHRCNMTLLAWLHNLKKVPHHLFTTHLLPVNTILNSHLRYERKLCYESHWLDSVIDSESMRRSPVASKSMSPQLCLRDGIIHYTRSLWTRESAFKTSCKNNESNVFFPFQRRHWIPWCALVLCSYCLSPQNGRLFCSFYVNVTKRGANTCELTEYAAAGQSCHRGAITLVGNFRALTSVRPRDVWWDIKQARMNVTILWLFLSWNSRGM